MNTLPTPADPFLHQLAHLVAEHGIESFESDIARLVVRFRAAGIHSPLIAVVGDKQAPAVVRERSLGHVLGLLLDSPRSAPRSATRSTTSGSIAA